MLYENRQQGFGVYVSKKYFLTVAQTLFTKEAHPVQIKANYLQIVLPFTCDQSMNVEISYPVNVLRYKIHPNYNAELFLNDIALLLVSFYIKHSILSTE